MDLNLNYFCAYCSPKEASCLRTCVYYISQDGYTDIDEQFVLDAASEENQMILRISILETTLSAAGEEIASGSVNFESLYKSQNAEAFREARISLMNGAGKEIGVLMFDATLESYKGSLVQKYPSNDHRGTNFLNRMCPFLLVLARATLLYCCASQCGQCCTLSVTKDNFVNCVKLYELGYFHCCFPGMRESKCWTELLSWILQI